MDDGFRRFFAGRFSLACTFVERRTWLAVLLLAGLYVPCVLEASRLTPISHDELFTQYISGAPTVRAMWSDLRGFDLNPPLSYLLTRWTLPIDGYGAFGLRLPEIAGFLVFLLGMFQLVRVRLGNLYGLFTAVLLMGSVLWELAYLARPYGLLLGFLGLALVAWQMTAGSRRGWGLALLWAACLGMVASHLFAVFSLAALAGAELWRGRGSRRTTGDRRVDWPVLLAMTLPVLVLPAYLPMMQSHGTSIFPAAFQPDGTMVFDFYTGSIERELIALCLTALLTLVLLGPAHLRGGRESRAGWFFSAAEWCGMILLMAGPMLLMARLAMTHGAFFGRYGAAANVGFAVLTTALLARWTAWKGRPDARAAMLGCVVVLLMSGLAFTWSAALAHGVLWPTRAHSEPGMLACQACARTATYDASVPLVDASGLTFLQMTHYESDATTGRLFYLTDAAASTQYAHANIFERMGEVVEHFHLRGHVQAYPEFLRTHPHFFVLGRYDYPEDWLLRALVADGAQLRVVGRVDDSYRDTELYEVRVR